LSPFWTTYAQRRCACRQAECEIRKARKAVGAAIAGTVAETEGFEPSVREFPVRRF